ncbi:MAG: hypothetical protein EBW30_00180 [Synechococcaceae bacterium WB7_3xG_012]|nr:hypothetical protein [Synechococcaceae bacterium WB7_3xG_012]
MKQLPGRQRPRWITVLLQGCAAVVATIWLASLLPYLLLMALVVSLMLIPTPFFENLYRQAAPRPMVDVTPPHRKLIRTFWQWRQRR